MRVVTCSRRFWHWKPIGARRQRLQQDVGAFHPGAGGGGAALGREAEVLAQLAAFALEADRRLQGAQDQDRQERRRQGRDQADPDGAQRTGGKPGHRRVLPDAA